MTQIYHATVPFGTFWLNVGYLRVPGRGLCVPIPYLIWDKSPFYLLQEVVWNYGAGVSTKRRLSSRNEKWLFFVRDSKSYTFNLDDIRDPNVKYPSQKKNGKYRCNPLGKNPSDVWQLPKVTTGAKRSSRERTSHPAQFPLPVVERIVRASSNVGDVVLDPFAGSFSAGIAACGAGRVFVGFEIREDYCELAIERYERFQRHRLAVQEQKSLF
jgi:adenine-specific DNA-methyltransferase